VREVPAAYAFHASEFLGCAQTRVLGSGSRAKPASLSRHCSGRPCSLGSLQGSDAYPALVRFAPQNVRTYFVTGARLFQVESAADLLRDAIRSYRTEGRFALHAFVIMPDHVHLLLTPAPNVSLEKAVQFIKGGFSFHFKSVRELWERIFNEVQIVRLEKYEACRRYIEENPVRARLSVAAQEYVYSSARLVDCVDPVPEHFIRG
jgi:putative transposase